MRATDPIAAGSYLSLIARAAGALLLAAALTLQSRRSREPFPKPWALSWSCLLVSCLTVGGYLATAQHLFWLLYLAAGWAYLAALLIGCRELALGHAVRTFRSFLLPGLLAVIILAGGLVPFFTDFDSLFSLQAGILGAGFAAAGWLLAGVPATRRSLPLTFMRIALAWLTVRFALSVPAFALAASQRPAVLAAALAYAPWADLAADLLLGVGMLGVVGATRTRS